MVHNISALDLSHQFPQQVTAQTPLINCFYNLLSASNCKQRQQLVGELSEAGVSRWLPFYSQMLILSENDKSNTKLLKNETSSKDAN